VLNPKEPRGAFDAMSTADWDLATEIESIVLGISNLALGMVQTDGVSASYIYLMRLTRLAQLDQPQYSCLELLQTKDNALHRSAVAVESFYSGAQRCLERLRLQLEARLPEPTLDDLAAMLLDPRVKNIVVTLVSEHRLQHVLKLLQDEQRSFCTQRCRQHLPQSWT